MTDPLSDIENEKAQKDLGVTAYRMYKGAQEEGATWVEAFWIVAAYFCGMFKSVSKDEDDTSGNS